MVNTLKIIASGALIAAWIGVFAFSLMNDVRVDDLREQVGYGLFAFLIVFSVMRPDFGKLQPYVRWPSMAACLLLIGLNLYWATPSERIAAAQGLGVLLAIGAFVTLVNLAHERWQKIQSPMTKIVVGTVFLTVVATVGVIGLIYAILHADWQLAIRNWDVTLLVLFLPLLLIGWWVLTEWQKKKT